MLIVFPLGLWVFSVICYAVYLASSVLVWRTVSLYAMGGGVVGGLLAAVPGVIDFLTLGPSRVLTIAMTHMISNTVALTIFTISLVLALSWEGHTLVPFILSLFGLLAMGIGGWLGGALVYEHGVGVSYVPPHVRAEEMVEQHV